MIKSKKTKKNTDGTKLAPPLVKEVDGTFTANKAPSTSKNLRKGISPIFSFEAQMLSFIKNRMDKVDSASERKQNEKKICRDRATKFYSFMESRNYDIDCFLSNLNNSSFNKVTDEIVSNFKDLGMETLIEIFLEPTEIVHRQHVVQQFQQLFKCDMFHAQKAFNILNKWNTEFESNVVATVNEEEDVQGTTDVQQPVYPGQLSSSSSDIQCDNVDSDDDGVVYVQDGDELGSAFSSPGSVVNLNAEIYGEQVQACNT